MIYLLLKIINPAAGISVSNLKDEIEKSALEKFGNNLKDLLEYMSSNYSIVVDKGEQHEGYIIHIFRGVFSGPNSTINNLIQNNER